MTQIKPAPLYFPTLGVSDQADLSPQVIERISLVLAGIDPALLELPGNASPSKTRTIQQVRFEMSPPTLSPSGAMVNDHRYLLWSQFPIEKQEFIKLWKGSRTVAGGQESTELIQHVHWLKKLDANFDETSFKSESDAKYQASLPDLSPRILFFLFRTAVRRIERDAMKPMPAPAKQSRIGMLIQKLVKTAGPPTPLVYFPESMLRETEAYVETAMKLGRVLRIANARARRSRAQA